MMSATALLPFCAAAQEETKRPNIMLIVVDDMGYSDLGCFGGEIESPNLDGLAANGVRFTQFFNSGRSCPSRASLLTGLYAHQAGITGMGLSLNRECVTIPEVLREAGYHTAMSGKWHLSLTQGIGNCDDQMKWLSHQSTFDNREFAPKDTYPCNRGFEEHWGTIWGVVNHFDPFSLVHNEEAIYTEAIPDNFYSTDFVTEKAIDMIDDLSRKEEPFFMYVSYNAPHWPLHAKPEDIAKYKGKYDQGWDVMRENRYNRMVELGLIDKEEVPVCRNESGRAWEKEGDKALQAANMEVHAAMIDCVDQGVGKILEKLKATGEYDNTIIIFTSDNGASSENYTIGEFDRHDRTRDGQMVTHNAAVPGDELTYNYLGTGWAGAVNTPFRYWKRESFHGGTAAPTIVHWPEGMKAEKGSIVKEPCHFIDMMPTCLELAGAEYPETYNGHSITPMAPEARSIVPLVNGENWDSERTMFWEHENGKAVRVGNWKMTALTTGGWELFNLENDYSETTNVAAQYPEKMRELRGLWNAWARRVGLNVPDEMPDTEKELVFYYPFDGSLEDASDHKYELDPHGYDFAEGKYGEALKLNGNGQYVDFSHPGIVNSQNTQYSVCAWVYDDETALPTSGAQEGGAYFRDQVILAQKDNQGTGRITLYTRIEQPVEGGEPNFYYVNFLGNRHNKSTAGAFQRGVWQHVAAVCNPGDRTVTFYVDGKCDAIADANAFEACIGGFRIGGHKANKDYWNGKIDELYFYKGLLTPEEVCDIRDNRVMSGLSTFSGEESGIVFDAISRSLMTADGSSAKSIEVHSIYGQNVKSAVERGTLSLADIEPGIYVVTAIDAAGNRTNSKFVLK